MSNMIVQVVQNKIFLVVTHFLQLSLSKSRSTPCLIEWNFCVFQPLADYIQAQLSHEAIHTDISLQLYLYCLSQSSGDMRLKTN